VSSSEPHKKNTNTNLIYKECFQLSNIISKEIKSIIKQVRNPDFYNYFDSNESEGEVSTKDKNIANNINNEQISTAVKDDVSQKDNISQKDNNNITPYTPYDIGCAIKKFNTQQNINDNETQCLTKKCGLCNVNTTSLSLPESNINESTLDDLNNLLIDEISTFDENKTEYHYFDDTEVSKYEKGKGESSNDNLNDLPPKLPDDYSLSLYSSSTSALAFSVSTSDPIPSFNNHKKRINKYSSSRKSLSSPNTSPEASFIIKTNSDNILKDKSNNNDNNSILIEGFNDKGKSTIKNSNNSSFCIISPIDNNEIDHLKNDDFNVNIVNDAIKILETSFNNNENGKDIHINDNITIDTNIPLEDDNHMIKNDIDLIINRFNNIKLIDSENETSPESEVNPINNKSVAKSNSNDNLSNENNNDIYNKSETVIKNDTISNNMPNSIENIPIVTVELPINPTNNNDNDHIENNNNVTAINNNDDNVMTKENNIMTIDNDNVNNNINNDNDYDNENSNDINNDINNDNIEDNKVDVTISNNDDHVSFNSNSSNSSGSTMPISEISDSEFNNKNTFISPSYKIPPVPTFNPLPSPVILPKYPVTNSSGISPKMSNPNFTLSSKRPPSSLSAASNSPSFLPVYVANQKLNHKSSLSIEKPLNRNARHRLSVDSITLNASKKFNRYSASYDSPTQFSDFSKNNHLAVPSSPLSAIKVAKYPSPAPSSYVSNHHSKYDSLNDNDMKQLVQNTSIERDEKRKSSTSPQFKRLSSLEYSKIPMSPKFMSINKRHSRTLSNSSASSMNSLPLHSPPPPLESIKKTKQLNKRYSTSCIPIPSPKLSITSSCAYSPKSPSSLPKSSFYLPKSPSSLSKAKSYTNSNYLSPDTPLSTRKIKAYSYTNDISNNKTFDYQFNTNSLMHYKDNSIKKVNNAASSISSLSSFESQKNFEVNEMWKKYEKRKIREREKDYLEWIKTCLEDYGVEDIFIDTENDRLSEILSDGIILTYLIEYLSNRKVGTIYLHPKIRQDKYYNLKKVFYLIKDELSVPAKATEYDIECGDLSAILSLLSQLRNHYHRMDLREPV